MAKRPADAGAASPRRGTEPFRELTDAEWDRRWDEIQAEHPGLFPRHVSMFLQIEERARRARHDALEWEREKGRAFATGAAQPLTAPQRGATTSVNSNND